MNLGAGAVDIVCGCGPQLAGSSSVVSVRGRAGCGRSPLLLEILEIDRHSGKLWEQLQAASSSLFCALLAPSPAQHLSSPERGVTIVRPASSNTSTDQLFVAVECEHEGAGVATLSVLLKLLDQAGVCTGRPLSSFSSDFLLVKRTDFTAVCALLKGVHCEVSFCRALEKKQQSLQSHLLDGNSEALRPPDFELQSYWEELYQQPEPPAEWYCDFHGPVEQVLRTVLASSHRHLFDKPCRILHIGCGSSSLADDIVSEFSQDLVAGVDSIDFAVSAIKLQTIRFHEHIDRLRFAVADARRLLQTVPPDENWREFNVVLDKGTLDAMRCGDSDGAREMIHSICDVLKPQGILMLLTCAPSWERIESLFEAPKLQGLLEVPPFLQEKHDDYILMLFRRI